jgi:hypothetical protein
MSIDVSQIIVAKYRSCKSLHRGPIPFLILENKCLSLGPETYERNDQAGLMSRFG